MKVVPCSTCKKWFEDWDELDAHKAECEIRSLNQEARLEALERARHENSFRTVYGVLDIVVDNQIRYDNRKKKWNKFMKRLGGNG